MDKKQKRQVYSLIFEIGYISFILIFLTTFFYLPRQYKSSKKDLGYQVDGLSHLSLSPQKERKTITVQNDDGKGDLMLVFANDNKNDNKVYYQVITNGHESDIRFLTEDGALYQIGLTKNEKTTVEVVLWTEENQVNGNLLLLPVVYENQI